jgi:hypothetical protein
MGSGDFGLFTAVIDAVASRLRGRFTALYDSLHNPYFVIHGLFGLALSVD